MTELLIYLIGLILGFLLGWFVHYRYTQWKTIKINNEFSKVVLEGKWHKLVNHNQKD